MQLSLEPTVGVVTKATRTPTAEIYATAIIPDLEFAITNLPLKQTDVYRATKGAAQTLLAEVYLTRAAAGDFDKARDLTTAGHHSGTYRLNPSYRALFCAGENADGACDYAPRRRPIRKSSSRCSSSGDGGTDAFGNNLHLYWVMAYDLGGVAAPTLAARARAYGRPYPPHEADDAPAVALEPDDRQSLRRDVPDALAAA